MKLTSAAIFMLACILTSNVITSTASLIDATVRSFTGASSSLHKRYASVNDRSIMDKSILSAFDNEKHLLRRRIARDDGPIMVDTHFHILIANETEGDDVDEATIDKQIQVLNEAFGGNTNSFYTDCNGNPAKSLETGFRFRKGAPTTRTTVDELEDPVFQDSITEEERATLFFLLQQGMIQEDLAAFEEFYFNQTSEEQMMTLATAPNAGLSFLPFLFGKKVRNNIHSSKEDDCTKLHIYIQPGFVTPIFGYAQEPWNCRQTKENRNMDGVFIHRGTLPDAQFESPNHNAMMGLVPAEEELSWANEGDTAVHEVGHWLGLTHTFAGAMANTTTGCDFYAGDEILDTPAQEMGSNSYCTEHPCCNQDMDSCPHIPGLDPVWNFMDYSDDCCMVRFTDMQAERMKQSWKLFREDYYAENRVEDTADSSVGISLSKESVPSNTGSSSGATSVGNKNIFGINVAAVIASVIVTSL